MAQIINRNGIDYNFPDDYTQQQIDQFFTIREAENKQQEIKDTQKAEEDKRGILTDIPVQIVGGVRDGISSGINLIEGVGQDIKEYTGYGGFTFGENAKNGLVQYHSYDDAINNNIKFPISGDITKTGDSAFDLPEVDEADTTTGNITRSITQFVTGWYATAPVKPLKFVKGSKATTKLAQSTARGAVADFVAFDGDTGRFVDMINDEFPGLQNPLFEYLSSEDKDEGFYEARFKNALEGALLGGLTEGLFRAAPKIKSQLTDMAKYIKLKRKSLTGQKFDAEKLKKIEEKLADDANKNLAPDGQGGTKKLVKSILEEATTDNVGNVVKTIKDKASADELNEKIVESFTNFIDNARIDPVTGKPKKTGLDFKNIDDALDFQLSPRAYADTNFGAIVLDTIQKVIKSEKQFDVISDKIIERQAAKAGGDIIQTTKMLGQLGDKLQDGLKFMYASQMVQQNLADALYKMANGIRRNTGEFTQNEMKLTTALLMRLMRFDGKVTSNLGRGLRLRGILKDSNTDLSQQSILDLVKGFDKWDGNFDDFVEAVALVKDKNALIRVTDFLFRNKFWNKANELWMSAALSLPKTQIVNITSTGLNAFIRPASQWVGSKLTWGLDDATRNQMKAQGDEAVAIMAGYKQYLSDAVTFMKKAFADEDSVLFAGSTKFDTNTKALGTGKWAKIIRTPLRALTAMDEFFKQITYRSKLTTIAVREARAKGLSTEKIVGNLPDGRGISEFEEYVSNRFRQGFDESGLIGVDAEAMRFAQEVTFTKDLDGILGKVQEITNEVPIAKQVLPFVKTPANLAIQAIEMSPLGVTGKNWGNFTGASRDAAKIAQTRGRVAIGTGILGLASMLSMTGNITGGYSSNPEIRKQQQANGFKPYSIKIGNTYIEYGRLDPIAMLVGTVADYTSIYSDLSDADRAKIENNLMNFMMNQTSQDRKSDISMGDKITNAVGASYKSVFKNIASKTYLRGLIDFLKAIDGEDADKTLPIWLQQKGASYIPNILTKAFNDPYLREAKTTVDAFKKKFGQLGDAPKRYNYLGEPVMAQGNPLARLFNNMVNPFTVQQGNQDFVLENTIKHNIDIPVLDKVKNGIDLTQFVNKNGKNFYDHFNEQMAKSPLRESLVELMKSDRFKDAQDEIVLDANNRFGGKKALVAEEVARWRDITFKTIQYSDEFKSKFNNKVSIGQAFINKEIFKSIGKGTNQYPEGFDTTIYNFLEKTK